MDLLPENRDIKTEFNLAKIWQAKGKLDRAIAGYKKILTFRDNYLPAYLELGSILLEQKLYSQATELYIKAIELFPNREEFHKNLVNALAGQEKLETAFNYYQLIREDSKEIAIAPKDILCCVAVRNESMRLPYFLDYYREKGVGKFLIVDNNSTDDSLTYLRSQADVYTWSSNFSFNQANFGSAWFEVLLRKYGIGHWCLIVDADEIFYYPECETRSIVWLCQELDRENKTAMEAILLDMYSDRPISSTYYTRGQTFLEICPYFDRQFYHKKYDNAGPYKNQTCYFGGVRERIFGAKGEYCLNKVPLLKYDIDLILASGQHWTNRSKFEITARRGCLLHFKYFSSFFSYVEGEVKREEHYDKGMQYREYLQVINKNKDLTFYDPKYSLQLENCEQLVNLGIIKIDKNQYQEMSIEFPQIPAIPKNRARPFWSVIITTYNRTSYLERSLASVLQQAPDEGEMQIEIVNDGADESIQTEIRTILAKLGGNRVNFYVHPQNLGHPHIFNICIQRARGEWIHLLHDDDWLKPGFYKAIQEGINQQPKIGGAFCRQIYTTERGEERWLSYLEKETPGIVENWLERIAVMCRLQFSAMVVKRETYEKLGGFCPQSYSTFDWEMWKRIACYYPVWFEPQPLMHFREHSQSLSAKLIASGKQIADSLQAIKISQLYLPTNSSERFSKMARENYAMHGLDLAKQQLANGNFSSALSNIRAALQCSQSERVKETLILLLKNG